MRPVNRAVVVLMVAELLGDGSDRLLAEHLVQALASRGCGWRLVPAVLADMDEVALANLVDEARDLFERIHGLKRG